MTNPIVSIITPAYYPTHEMLDKSYFSVDSQSADRESFEWIVVSDGDGTFLKESTDTYIAEVSLGGNFGPSVARNIGFQIASGDIITYLDMGDELHSNRVTDLINMFSMYEIDLLFSAYKIQYPDNTSQLFDPFNYIQGDSAKQYVKLLNYQNISIPLGVAHTRKYFVEAGGFQRGIVCGEDGILWRRMVEKLPENRTMFTNTIAGTYYVSESGQSRTQRRFEMGGFAFDGSKNDNGRYLDKDWYSCYNSKGLYD